MLTHTFIWLVTGYLPACECACEFAAPRCCTDLHEASGPFLIAPPRPELRSPVCGIVSICTCTFTRPSAVDTARRSAGH